MTYTTEDKSQATEDIKRYIKDGDTVFTILRHVSQSGMSRDISLVVFRDNEPIWLDYWYCVLTDSKPSKKEGVKVSGAGMDMGYQMVNTLSSVVFGNGYKLKHRWL